MKTVNWIFLVEFEETLFPGLTTLQMLREIPGTMEENRIQPEKFEDRIVFMAMYNDIGWGTAEKSSKFFGR